MVRCDRRLLLMLAAGIALWISPAWAQPSYFPPEMQEKVEQIVNHSVMQDYDAARAICLEMERAYPEHPGGYFFRAAVLQSKMMDYENYAELDEFFRLTRRALELARRDIKKYRQNSWPYFFLGASLGYRAFYYFREKNYLQAFHDGWNAIKMLERSLELDSTNYDVYLGIGAFKYYKSKYSKSLQFLPFVTDERELGIRLIRKTIEMGKFAYPAALNALTWILLEEGRYAEAEATVREALQKYPGSRFFLWGKAAVAYRQEKWTEAREAYEGILASYVNDPGGRSPFNEMVCHAMLATIYQKTGNGDLARRHAEEVLQIRIDRRLKKRAKPYLKLASQILEEVRAGE